MLADDKPHTPEKVDALVSAEIPDATTQPRLFNTITTQMIHGPCGHMNPNCVCMEGERANKHCTKNFPKDFQNVTKLPKNGHALYRRRSPSDGGKTVEIKCGNKTYQIDNSFVVPYSPKLRFPAIWDKRNKQWNQRKYGVKDDNGLHRYSTVGRIPIIGLSAHQTELYCLRLLLYNTSGATSYDDLRTVNETTFETNQSACVALGLLQDDEEIDKALMEVTQHQFGNHVRDFFVSILLFCGPPSPIELFQKWKKELAHDYLYRDNLTEINIRIENELLLYIQDKLERESLSLQHFQLPQPSEATEPNAPRVLHEEMDFNTDELKRNVQLRLKPLNNEQMGAYTQIIEAAQTGQGALFCLNASGGTRKTYLLNLMLDTVRTNGDVALATALSGIAATLLHNGRTLHSRLKVPIKISDTSVCNISCSNRDSNAVLLRKAKLLIIDEVTMGHKDIYHCIDRSLEDIRQSSTFFGGLTVVFNGDWKQISPVVKRGSRPEITNACLKSSYLWPHIKRLQLKENTRVISSATSQQFSDYLHWIGSGGSCSSTSESTTISIPDELYVTDRQLNTLCDFVYNELSQKYSDPQWLPSRAIITPTNVAAEEVNRLIIKRFPGNIRTYASYDSVEGVNEYPIEFINSLEPSGLPPHILTLTVGSIIIRLRNFDAVNGHCNGTRYKIVALHDHVINTIIASGTHAGRKLLILRIPLKPSDNDFPFDVTRRQFPVKLAFAITANKSEGQTSDRTGIFFPTPMFSHGQLYVALSRTTSYNLIKYWHQKPQRRMLFTRRCSPSCNQDKFQTSIYILPIAIC